MSKGLNELRDEAYRIAREHGFKDASIPEDVALMHSELSELLEDHRDSRLAHEMHYEEEIPVYDPVGSPLATDGSVFTDAETQKPLTARVKRKEAYEETSTDCPICRGRGNHLAAVADRDPTMPCSTCKGTGKKLRYFKPCGIPSELADVVIRVLHFSGKHGVDIEAAVAEKMRFNDSRPYKHGKIL